MSVQERLRLLKAELKSAAYAYETTVRRWRTNSLRGKSSERKGLSTKASLEKRDDIVKRWGLAIERIEIELERMERAIKAVDAASWPARKGKLMVLDDTYVKNSRHVDCLHRVRMEPRRWSRPIGRHDHQPSGRALRRQKSEGRVAVVWWTDLRSLRGSLSVSSEAK